MIGSVPLGLERALSLRGLRWLRVDWHVLGLALALLGCGLVFVHAMGEADGEGSERSSIVFSAHLKKVLVALPALALGLAVRPRWLRRNAWLVYAASIALLALVPILGEERNSAKRWIALPGVGFDLQPSELAKLGLIVMLARVLYTCRLRRAGEWVPPVAIALLPMGLVAMQPDLGTAMTIVPVTLGMLYLAGARPRRLVQLVLAAALLAFGAWRLELIRDYQLQRVETWLASLGTDDLIQGRNGPAFHTYHARVAIGNGGLFGTGLGRGVANEAGHLPERSSDSIFAVVAEEAGLFGAGAILALYALFIALLFMSASGIRERFSRLAVGGVALYFAAHFFVNVGVNLGLLPMTGLTLPLVSTGGSSLLASFLALGLALGLSSHHEPSLDADAFRD
ncbi:MAG TPA: FtsW/RodA/SpoVE family cell cycle protein [Planctomycetota bacterium]|nr:FtsW/RodA/SpoVE family cell cycle protein [Planctomycetota bacterium]